MNSIVYHTCHKCGHETEIDYDLGEHFAECGDEKCEKCCEPIELDYDDLEEQAMCNLADRADYFKD